MHHQLNLTSPVLLSPSRSTRVQNMVTIDFHFGSGEIVRYRTDITFGWLDLMGESFVFTPTLCILLTPSVPLKSPLGASPVSSWAVRC